MDSDYETAHYYIDDTLLLKFLITRYTEMLGSDEPKLDPIWAGLGLTGLHQNRELENAFNILISSGSYTVQEALTISTDLFWVELQRLEAVDTTDYLGKSVERRPLSRRTARKFLFWSWREGRKMSIKQDFRFYSIWEVVAWRALNSDEYIKGFEQKCLFSSVPQEEKLDQGLQIVKAALFRRRIDSNSFLHDMLKTGTPIDKETQE